MAERKQLGEVKLQNVRLSFAHIFRPQKFSGDDASEPRYNCAFLIPKKDEKQIARIKQAINAVAREKWGQDLPKLRADKICLRDGDDEDWDGYAGNHYVTASNVRRPVIVDRDRTPLAEADGKPYSGCYVNAVIRIWAQDNQYGKRINASLEAIQFVKDGDAFGAKPVDPEEAFDDLGDDDDFGDGDEPDGADDSGGLV